MKTEPVSNRCPKCQAPLPANALQGLCPKCLLVEAAAPTEAGQSADKDPPPGIATVAAAFPQLEIIELIGQGGMGFVYKARQPKLDRFVALKILPQALAADPAFAERFNREARVLARLNHPNIVAVHDFGQAGGFFYLLMEFVDGVNLRQAMQASRFTPQQAMLLVPRICEALQFAHDEGILHRDIKPENILLDSRGRLKIADFGIAKLVGDIREPVNLTGSGLAVGTPHYMAPEQLEHPHEVDQRADIYSLGVVFYEMLTGELPIGRFAPPSQKTTVDVRVDEVVLHALEKEREKRYRTATEVKTSVEAITSTAGSASDQPAASASAARSGSVAAAVPERHMRCYLSTPEHLRTFTGRFLYIYTAKGELRLDSENLTFVSGWQTTVMPLRAIKELGIGHYSRFGKPLRLDYLAATFEQNANPTTLLFTLAQGPLGLPWNANRRTHDCLRAVREAVIARTGTPPRGPSPADLPQLKPGFLANAFTDALPIFILTGVIAAGLTLVFQSVFHRQSGYVAVDLPKQCVIDTVPLSFQDIAHSAPAFARWRFKCLVPPNHLARLLFIHCTNGVPIIVAGLSAYFKVGTTPTDFDIDISCDPRQQGTNVTADTVQWNVSYGLGFTTAYSLPAQPLYRKLENYPPRMATRSGHQRLIPLVDYVENSGGTSPHPPDIQLRILLEPLKSPPVRTVPTEIEVNPHTGPQGPGLAFGAFIAGTGLDCTMQDALKMLKQLPVDP